jgi:hypothetical protein
MLATGDFGLVAQLKTRFAGHRRSAYKQKAIDVAVLGRLRRTQSLV